MSKFDHRPRTFHVHLSIRGYLRGATKRELGQLFEDGNGRQLSADEAREHLMDLLAQGKEVIPLGETCEGFDFSGNGCPGHLTDSPAT
jgi:hypothetical protein